MSTTDKMTPARLVPFRLKDDALLVDKEAADQVWETLDSGEIDEQIA